MASVRITIGDAAYNATLEEALAPVTCAAFRTLLPLRGKLLQARWSGQAAWIPLDGVRLAVGLENQMHRPAPGQILFYPEGESDTEILLPYGGVCFASKMGQLAGNHFLTVTEGLEKLPELGKKILWEGALDITFSAL